MQKGIAIDGGRWYNEIIRTINNRQEEITMFQCKMISSLTKVFLDQEPVEEKLDVSILRGETASFQVAVLAYGDVWVTAAAPGLKVTVRGGSRCLSGIPVCPVWRMTTICARLRACTRIC